MAPRPLDLRERRPLPKWPSEVAGTSPEASADEARRALEGSETRASVAAINGPRAVVISGETSVVRAVAQRFEADGRSTRRLSIARAVHSPLVVPMLDAYREVAASLTYSAPSTPVITGRVPDTRTDTRTGP